MNIYVGNLSYRTTEDELRRTFEVYGAVSDASIIRDRESGQSKGFGFIEMPSDSEAEAAIAGLNDKEIGGRRLRVNQARPREDSGYRGGGGGGGVGGVGGSRPPSRPRGEGGDRGGSSRGGDRGGSSRGGDRGGSSRRDDRGW
jgi:RNA recognition motif-containing protein